MYTFLTGNMRVGSPEMRTDLPYWLMDYNHYRQVGWGGLIHQT